MSNSSKNSYFKISPAWGLCSKLFSMTFSPNGNPLFLHYKHFHFPKRSPTSFQDFSSQQIINLRSRGSEK